MLISRVRYTYVSHYTFEKIAIVLSIIVVASLAHMADLRLESQGSLVRYPAEKYVFILHISLVSLPYRSAEPLQMKSIMTILL